VSAIGSDDKSTTFAGVPAKVRQYVRSSSTRMAAFGGLITYVLYAYAHGSWSNLALIAVSVFVGVFLPSYAKFSNKAELWANNRFGFVTAGKLGRFLPQYVFNLIVFWMLLAGDALNRAGMASVGGAAGAALVTTLASQGAQYLAIYLFQRGVGDANRNVLVGVLVNSILAALGTAGVPYARELFLLSGLVLGLLFFGVGVLSDLRSVVAPKGGIGLFFGTFNPFHNTHLRIIQQAIAERGLDKVIIHPTLIPRIHSDAFRKGQLRVARLENGFQIYERTENADLNVDYFPSGRQFLPPETRKALIELAVAEVGLSDKVEVAFYPEVYNKKGFQGVIAEIKRRHPGVRLHGLHGTDNGGMAVRGIFDECGWIYPWRILRRDNVSATAIRRGAKGMTSNVVTDVLGQLTQNPPEVAAGGRRFRNENGALSEGG
jgi:nicotinic acid mononucleotide adenylyltransferase